MRLFCRLCGTRTDGQERLGVYCPGTACGADQRAAGDTGVQAWCEPARQRGEPGRTSVVRLVVRNAGRRPDTYRVEPVEQVAGRLDFDAMLLTMPLAPGETRTVEMHYTPPRDHVGLGIDVASRFGIPGADAAGQGHDARGGRFGVALRVVSTGGTGRAAACAAFALDVPRHFSHDGNGRGGGRRGGGRAKLLAKVAVAALSLIAGGAIVVNVTVNNDSGGSGTAAPAATATVSQVTVSGPAPADDVDDESSPHGAGGNNGNPGGAKGGGNQEKAADAVVPKTEGMTTQEAKDAMAKAGLVAQFQDVANSRGPQGAVIETQPAAGTTVKAKSTVVVRVHDGKTVVPDVTGMDQDTARSTLSAAGLASKFATVKVSDAARYNVAVRTEPAAGTSAGVLSGVTVYLGTADIR